MYSCLQVSWVQETAMPQVTMPCWTRWQPCTGSERTSGCLEETLMRSASWAKAMGQPWSIFSWSHQSPKVHWNLLNCNLFEQKEDSHLYDIKVGIVNFARGKSFLCMNVLSSQYLRLEKPSNWNFLYHGKQSHPPLAMFGVCSQWEKDIKIK